MKRHFNNCLLIILTLCLSSCVQIDKSILYHKGYNIGVNKNFRLDGFYSDTISRPVFKTKSFSKIKPIFLYSDGSALILETIKDIDALKTLIQLKDQYGTWGNYKISNDTLTIETFLCKRTGDSFNRYLDIGLIKKDKIVFVYQIDNKGTMTGQTLGTVYFNLLDCKPDSSLNWVRKKIERRQQNSR